MIDKNKNAILGNFSNQEEVLTKAMNITDFKAKYGVGYKVFDRQTITTASISVNDQLEKGFIDELSTKTFVDEVKSLMPVLVTNGTIEQTLYVRPFNKEEIEKAEDDEFDQLEKGGEGSRGGKIIGHTKSGKPIYESYDFSKQKDYTSDDHEDAANVHKDKKFDMDKAAGIKERDYDKWREGGVESIDDLEKVHPKATDHFWSKYNSYMKDAKREHNKEYSLAERRNDRRLEFDEDDHHEDALEAGMKSVHDKYVVNNK